jgi:hypothetical protein
MQRQCCDGGKYGGVFQLIATELAPNYRSVRLFVKDFVLKVSLFIKLLVSTWV